VYSVQFEELLAGFWAVFAADASCWTMAGTLSPPRLHACNNTTLTLLSAGVYPPHVRASSWPLNGESGNAIK